MKKVLIILILLMTIVLAFLISHVGMFRSHLSIEDSFGSDCRWPFCEQVEFTQEAFINGIYEANPEATQTSAIATTFPQGTYHLSINFSQGNIWNYEKGFVLPKPYFKHINFVIKNINDLDYFVEGKKVNKDIFLKESFGAKAEITGIGQVNHRGPDAGDQYSYLAKSINILQTSKKLSESCKDCKTFDNEWLSFKYGPDWQVINASGSFITLRRIKYYKDENPKWCLVGNNNCDCGDINKKCAYEIQLTVSSTTRTEYGNVFPKDKSYRVFSNYHNTVFSYPEDGLNGARFFAEGALKNIYMSVNDESHFLQGIPFAMENDSLMPYAILSSLVIKK